MVYSVFNTHNVAANTDKHVIHLLIIQLDQYFIMCLGGVSEESSGECQRVQVGFGKKFRNHVQVQVR